MTQTVTRCENINEVRMTEVVMIKKKNWREIGAFPKHS
jgi:hypothetical protein